MKTEIIQLNKKLISTQSQPITPGLLYGKMGYCIYFFEMGRMMNDKHYTKHAEALLDVICKETTRHLPVDIENGLLGIGLGVSNLIKEKFISGNENDVLEKFDIPVFKTLAFNKQKIMLTKLKFQLLYYLSVRYKFQKAGSDKEYIFKELIFTTLNSFTQHSIELWEEPFSFSLQYQLPFFLYTLGLTAEFAIFQHKIAKIVDELTPEVISLIPVSHAHRLYLMLGMCSINKTIDNPLWRNHVRLLKREIDINHILTEEFRDRNVFLIDGLAGVLLLISIYNRMVCDSEKISFDIESMQEKITSSTVWSHFKIDDNFFKANSNMNGFCGIALAMLKHYNK